MLSSPLKQFSWRIMLWLPFSIGLWWLIQPFLLTATALPLSYIVSYQFEREQMSLEVISSQQWVIHSEILSDTAHPETNKRHTWSIQFSALKAFGLLTLGLPLLWSLLLAIPESRLITLQKLLLGSILLILAILLAEYLLIIFKIQELKFIHGGTLFVYPGIFVPVTVWPQWQLELLKTVVTLMSYFCILVLPAFIWFQMSTPFIRTVLLSYQLRHSTF